MMITENWKKAAAQMAPASNTDIEKSFFDLAYPGSHRLYRDLVLVEKESRKSKRQMCSCHPIYGKYDRDIQPENDGVVTPESGKAYRIYDPHARALTDPFYVTAVDTNSAGLKEATVVCF